MLRELKRSGEIVLEERLVMHTMGRASHKLVGNPVTERKILFVLCWNWPEPLGKTPAHLLRSIASDIPERTFSTSIDGNPD